MPKALSMEQRSNLDAESRGLIYQGASVNQLAAIFKPVKADEIMRRLGDLQPVGTGRQGNPIYDVAEAAARIVRPQLTAEAIDRYMRTANAASLPATVNKHYWDGMRSRERYREEIDELWLTEDVTRMLSECFQMIRASLVLLPDLMRARGDMSEPQFRFVQRLVDDMIEDVGARLVSHLVKPSRSDSADRADVWDTAGAL